jgi:hypothetical protein
MFLMRLAMAAAALLLSYFFWRHVARRLASGRRTQGQLIGAYVLTRAGGWLVFALFLQQHVVGSDPSMFYTPMLKGFLAGKVPIRDFPPSCLSTCCSVGRWPRSPCSRSSPKPSP